MSIRTVYISQQYIQMASILGRLFAIGIDIGMAIAPVTGYVLQYRLILNNRSVGAFSIDICLVLLFANILRVNFFLFEQYKIALLFQSLIMITAQMMLLKVCTQYRDDPPQEQDDEDEEDFWRWSNFWTYVKHVTCFTLGSLTLSAIALLIGLPLYGATIGLVSLLSESMLILPQILEICRQMRVRGISYSLLFLNLIGDLLKTVYFFVNDQPFQFKLCGIIQLVLDVVVLSQVAYYHQNQISLQSQTELQKQSKKDTNLHKSVLQSAVSVDMELTEEINSSISQTQKLKQETIDAEQQEINSNENGASVQSQGQLDPRQE